jgi:hypothetical protein
MLRSSSTLVQKGATLLSHIVHIKTQVRDPVAVQAACRRLGLAEPVLGKHQLFSGEVTGLGIQLPGWHYPVVFDTATAEARFDNYAGHWGEQKELDRFTQMYAVEKAKIEARRRGHSVTEQTLDDGSIKLTVQIAGGA